MYQIYRYYLFFIFIVLSGCAGPTGKQNGTITHTHKNTIPQNYCNSSYVNDTAIYSPPPSDFPTLNDNTNHQKAKECGVWESVIPDKQGAAWHNILGMQTVHSVLLPSGKILMSSGSSWRNKLDVDYYPKSDNPTPNTGLFNVLDDPFAKDKIDDYYELVNNVAIYDPSNNSFYRIHHPVPADNPTLSDQFAPNDQFCSGHLHLANGNVLFAGGTEYYYPFRTGSQSSFIFDWRKELDINWKNVDWQSLPEITDDSYLWTFSGFMQRGRWYPSMVPLNDGRIALFSGFVDYGNPKVQPPMYQFEINTLVEFFDPSKFNKDRPQDAWKAVDVKDTVNSPFNTRIYDSFEPTVCDDLEHFKALRISGNPNSDNTVLPPCTCDERCRNDNLYDAFKLYPNNYAIKNNKIFLSREGDWVSLRTADTAYMRRTKNTYWANIEGTAEAPEISFTRGQDRPELITSYGTSYFDPTANNVVILGGQSISAGTSTSFIPRGDDYYNPTYQFEKEAKDSMNLMTATRFLGGLGSSKIEQFNPPQEGQSQGEWQIKDNFLGDFAQDNRTMASAIVLPTKEVLVINGGNYDFYGPILYPTLLTPTFDKDHKFIRYTTRKLTDAVEPRLYHNTAMLLPDGRIWVSGGNSARASVGLHSESDAPKTKGQGGQQKPDLSLIDIDMYFFQDGQMAKSQKGMLTTPTENWTAEIFSPPYLFIGGSYRPKINAIINENPKQGITFSYQKSGRSYYLLQSNQRYTLELADLPVSGEKKTELVLIKLPSFTHNWDQGHKFISVPLVENNCMESQCSVGFNTPDFLQSNIPPGFYMMFYLDVNGKPSQATMVRLDDKALAP